MDFAYAPPPPPPSSRKNGPKKPNNSSKGNLQRNNKNNAISKPNQNSRNQYQQDRTDLPTSILDLPTHLPNIAPSEEVPSSGITDIPREEDEGFEDDDKLLKKDPSEPTFIQGTSITLQTEEDILKWIEERKKNWPSRKNIEKKEKLNQQKSETNSSTSSKKRPYSQDATEREVKDKKQKNICRFYQQHGHCKFGSKCKNVHESTSSINPVASTNVYDSTHYRRNVNGVPVLIPKLYVNRNSKVGQSRTSSEQSSLFKHLVKKDNLENENKIILDFVQFLEREGLIDHDVMKEKQ
ncbi:hypothetical protein G9P44_004325 [Scheffersomyces stipitis]|nr:hypothetical protein G9P44_004325 [Scheffersomyces stipitis]